MDYLSPLVELVKGFWGLASKPLGYIYNLKDDVDSLKNATRDLEAVSRDVKKRVKAEEAGGAQLTDQVENWLGKVQEFEGEVDEVLQEAGERDRIKCLNRYLPQNCWSSYKSGQTVNQLLNKARELQNEKGGFSVFTTSLLPPPQVLKMPMDTPVGLDRSINEVWKWLMDEKEVGVIGLYGTGGVGKTTLMKWINSKLLLANPGFDIVIWVVVSQQVNEDSIRDDIRRRLHVQDESWNRWTRDERVHHLCDALTQKKFVLLIDDVWRWLDLSNIGVPCDSLKKGSKVVFTTRLKQVCGQMKANKTLKVQCLTPEEAFKLFEEKIGELPVDFDQEIPDLVKDIAEECKGLPLALITVGRAMARKDNPREWRHALTMLRNNPHKLPGMVEEVYHTLEFSYNNLYDSTYQACFLYFCLFPNDYPIIKDEIIELWIGEGLLGDTDTVYHMRVEGEFILENLESSSLLESGHGDYGEQYVKMHGVIHGMATWIARNRVQRENSLLVIEKEEDMSVEMISKWREAKKVSLWGRRIRGIDQTPPQCSQLETLFIRKTNVKLVPIGFFDSMTACLTVLDMSDSRNIQSFPKGICNLINLRYLNLSATIISELPREIKNLTRLRWLLLDNTKTKILIPTGAIKSLPLIVFSQWSSNTSFGRSSQATEEEMVEELMCMEYLIDLSICVSKSSSAWNIFQSRKLSRCVRRAWISDKENDLTSIVISYLPADSDGFPHLEALHLYNCFALKKMEITQRIGRAPDGSCFPSLVTVHIQWCGLSDLSWLVHAPVLRELRVMECKSMEKIIDNGFAPEELAASGLFSHLETLYIDRLPNLTSICDQTLSFPPGASFSILGCPRLKKLPLDLNSVTRRFSVYGDAGWWAEFEGDPAARVTLKLGKSAIEMTLGEAVRKMKDKFVGWATVEFRP